MTLHSLRIKELESRLHADREAILHSIRQHLHRSGDPETLVLANQLEEIDNLPGADLLNEIEIARLNHDLSELCDLDATLLRIKAGTYGVCASCGESISYERMDAYPAAQYCLACQEKFEKE